MSWGVSWRLAGAAIILLLASSGIGAAETLSLDGDFVQGGLVRGRTEPGARVIFAGRRMRVAEDGGFVIGFGRDQGPSVPLEVTLRSGARIERSLAVAARVWDIQRIDGLPERQVTPSPEDLVRIRADAEQIAAARARDSPEPFFASGFAWPLIGRISGVYGSQRILNGEPRQPHFGGDIAAPIGAAVVSAAAGVVALTHEDMFFTGKTVVIDHGFGLSSAYSHLSEITVAAGARVAQGQTIGRVGATGRVTGAHLDWRVNLFDIRLDPALLAPPMPPLAAPAGAGG